MAGWSGQSWFPGPKAGLIAYRALPASKGVGRGLGSRGRLACRGSGLRAVLRVVLGHGGEQRLGGRPGW